MSGAEAGYRTMSLWKSNDGRRGQDMEAMAVRLNVSRGTHYLVIKGRVAAQTHAFDVLGVLFIFYSEGPAG